MAITLKRQISNEEKEVILERYGRRCFANGHAIPERDPVHFDHIHAYALGGRSDLDNIAPMCEAHNKAKGTLPLEDFRVKLKLTTFFESGDRLTLKDLLKHLKEIGDIDAFGNRIEVKLTSNEVHVENHSFSSSFQLCTCPLTGWRYFYGTLPVSVLNSDDDDEHNVGLQPRFLIFTKVFNMFRHFQFHPVLQPSIGRIFDGQILLFDGQHKIASLLWTGRSDFECKIYIDPDPKVLNQTNISAHDKFAQTRFFSSIMILKLGNQFGKDFEAYRNLEDDSPKSEYGFMQFLNGSTHPGMSRGERNRRFRSYLFNSILEDDENKIKPLVSIGNRGSNTQPITVDMLSKSIFACFLFTEPVSDDMATPKYKREQEFKNNIAILNMLFDQALSYWNPKAPKGNTTQTALRRQFASKSIMAWSEIVRDAILAKLDLVDGDERRMPFYRSLSEKDLEKVSKVIERLLGWQRWKAPIGDEIDVALAGNKKILKEWFINNGFTPTYLMGIIE